MKKSSGLIGSAGGRAGLSHELGRGGGTGDVARCDIVKVKDGLTVHGTVLLNMYRMKQSASNLSLAQPHRIRALYKKVPLCLSLLLLTVSSQPQCACFSIFRELVAPQQQVQGHVSVPLLLPWAGCSQEESPGAAQVRLWH
jgi:hypothetical protein